MDRVEDDPRPCEAEEMDPVPNPLNADAILGLSSDPDCEDGMPMTTPIEEVRVKSELVEQSLHPKSLCLVPNCGRKFVTNVNEGQVMFRFPAQNQIQSRVWMEILGLKNPADLSPWTMDDDYFVCGLHFAGGVCSKVIGHPSFIPTRFPPGVKVRNVIMPPLDPRTVLTAANFHQPIAMPVLKREIDSDSESDSEIDEPHADVPIPPNRNEKCDPLAIETWSQLPTNGDILRAVIVTFTNETGSSVESIVEHIFQLWTKVKCPPIPVTAISIRVRNLMASVSGLIPTEILGARKSEFAGLFNLACPAEERTAAFNYELYRDQLSARQLYFSDIGETHKPDQSPDQAQTEVLELKDTPLPTWLQLPTSKEVLETVEHSPFTARTVAKIIRSLWKRARCHPRNLAFVEDQIRAIRKNGPTESNELFDIAREKPLRPADFSDAFYQDQKSIRRMFLTPLDIPPNLKARPIAPPYVEIINLRSLHPFKGWSEPSPAKRPRIESNPNSEGATDPLETRQIALKSKSIPRIVWTNPATNSKPMPKSQSIFDPRCNGMHCRCNLDLSALKKIVVACRKFGLTNSPVFKTTKDALISHGVIGRVSELSDIERTSNVDESGHQDLPSSELPNDFVAKLIRERYWNMKEKELYRQVLLEQGLMDEHKKPKYQLRAEINHLAQRNQRYQDIISFYRENTINPSNTHKVMGVLHQKLLDAQETIEQYELGASILEMVQEAKNDLQNAVTVEGCRAIVNQLLVNMIQRGASNRGQTWTSKQWLDEDALLDVYEAEILDPLQEYELMKCDVPWVEHAYNCSDCHVKLASQANLDDHRILHCVSLNRCHVCALKVSTEEMDKHLKDHAQKHDLDSPLTCAECQIQVPNLTAMQTHVKEIHSNQVYCICCDSRFRSDIQLAYHSKYEISKSRKAINCTLIVCPYCGKIASRNPGVHLCATIVEILMKDDSVDGFNCRECAQKFLRRSHYNSHMGLVHGQGVHVCNICSRSVLKSALKDHLMTHTLIRPFKCPKCDTTAQSKAVIWTHLKGVHGEKKPDNGTIEVIPEEYEKRQRFRKDVQAGIKEFIEPLDHIPGKYVGKEPKSSKTRKRRQGKSQAKQQVGITEEETDSDMEDQGEMSDVPDTDDE